MLPGLTVAILSLASSAHPLAPMWKNSLLMMLLLLSEVSATSIATRVCLKKAPLCMVKGVG